MFLFGNADSKYPENYTAHENAPPPHNCAMLQLQGNSPKGFGKGSQLFMCRQSDR